MAKSSAPLETCEERRLWHLLDPPPRLRQLQTRPPRSSTGRETEARSLPKHAMSWRLDVSATPLREPRQCHQPAAMPEFFQREGSFHLVLSHRSSRERSLGQSTPGQRLQARGEQLRACRARHQLQPTIRVVQRKYALRERRLRPLPTPVRIGVPRASVRLCGTKMDLSQS